MRPPLSGDPVYPTSRIHAESNYFWPLSPPAPSHWCLLRSLLTHHLISALTSLQSVLHWTVRGPLKHKSDHVTPLRGIPSAACATARKVKANFLIVADVTSSFYSSHLSSPQSAAATLAALLMLQNTLCSFSALCLKHLLPPAGHLTPSPISGLCSVSPPL